LQPVSVSQVVSKEGMIFTEAYNVETLNTEFFIMFFCTAIFKPTGPVRSLCVNPTTFIRVSQQVFFPEACTVLLP
jgi:hypothetical protein